MSDLENRLRKNAKHRFKWAKREGLTAFRLYDLDMPEWPFAIDWYGGFVHVMEYPRRKQVREGTLEAARAELVRACVAVLEVPSERVFTKTHEKHAWGSSQYEAGGARAASITTVVEEQGLRFECNLTDFLDTGLFLDHRLTRARVRAEASGKRFLNLFAYTGSFSVYARAGGAAESTTVDLSNTYCDWAERNFALNALAPSPRHRVLRDDALAFVEHCRDRFDLVVLDPPSFSASKKMDSSLNVQRDHRRLIQKVRDLLAPGGTLYFSTNYQDFALDRSLHPEEELTPRSIPEDFRRTVHRCWRFARIP